MGLSPLAIRLSFAAAVVALALAAACGGGSDSTPTPSASASPTPTQLIVTPGPTTEPPQTAYWLVFRETTPLEDVIWAVTPNDLAQKEILARITHREGYPVRATLSPDGEILAYLSLPEIAISPDSSQAEAYIIDLRSEDKAPVLLGTGIDYQYTPHWSPDSRLLYMRRYAGPEFLAANVSIVRSIIGHTDDATPTPSPTLPAGVVPWPGIDPLEVVLQDSVAHVLKFAPIGFADDDKSMFFVQEQGGTGGGTLVGIYAPATTEEVRKVHLQAEISWYTAQAENQAAIDSAIANGFPVPETTITPAPTPTPDVRFVVQLSDQSIAGYSLSPDMHKIAYLNQVFTDAGDIENQTYVADLVAAATAVLPVQGLSVGEHLSPVWFPDGRLTVSVLPDDGGPGQLAIVALDLTSIALLAQPESGFDVPRAWAPDGTWLAVSHMSGSSLANPGDGRLELVSVNGQRATVIEGTQNAGEDSVLGWLAPEAEPPAE
jgi:hypothetical protein